MPKLLPIRLGSHPRNSKKANIVRSIDKRWPIARSGKHQSREEKRLRKVVTRFSNTRREYFVIVTAPRGRKTFQDTVSHTMESRTFVATVAYVDRSVQIDTKDFQSLNGRLYDSLVEYVAVLLAIRHEKFFVVPPYAVRIVLGFDYVNSSVISRNHGTSIVEREALRLINFKDRKLIMPLCNYGHFVLLEIDIMNKTLRMWDSLGTGRRRQANGMLQKFFRTVSNAKFTAISEIQEVLGCLKEWKAKDVPCSKQKDGMSCGIFLLVFVGKLLAGEDSFVGNINVTKCRTKLRAIIMQSFQRYALCANCGGSMNDLIQCHNCGLSFYHEYLENSNLGVCLVDEC